MPLGRPSSKAHWAEVRPENGAWDRARAPWRAALRGVGVLLLVAVASLLAATVSYAGSAHTLGVVLVWAPAGLVPGLLLLQRRRTWPWTLAGALLGNVLGTGPTTRPRPWRSPAPR